MYRVNNALVFKGEAAVKVVDGMTVGLKWHRAVRVPFEEQRPVFGVIAAEQAKLIHSLIMTEPTSASGRRGVDRGEQVVLLAPFAAIGLCPASLYKRGSFGFGEIVEAVRLVGGGAEILNAIIAVDGVQNTSFQPTVTPRCYCHRKAVV